MMLKMMRHLEQKMFSRIFANGNTKSSIVYFFKDGPFLGPFYKTFSPLKCRFTIALLVHVRLGEEVSGNDIETSGRIHNTSFSS